LPHLAVAAISLSEVAARCLLLPPCLDQKATPWQLTVIPW